MNGENDLQRLLAGADPQLRPEPFVFSTVSRMPHGLAPFAVVAEDEGLTVVVTQHEADEAGLDYDYVAALITLRVHSALSAVGLTAAVATKLARAGISCNIIAGFYHDHLLVPFGSGHRAVTLLSELSQT